MRINTDCFIILLIISFLFLSCDNSKSKNDINENKIFAPLSKYYPNGIISDKKLKIYDDLFSSIMKKTNFNGSVLVALNGYIVYEYNKGYSNIQLKDELTDSSLFQIASITKMFTASAILLLKQEGKLKLDDKVTKYIPSFKYPNITILQLLQHRSGLPKYEYLSDNVSNREKGLSNMDVINLLNCYYPPLNFTPGSNFLYSNTGYVVLALIIEKVSGQKYSDFLSAKLFKPSEMNNTFVVDKLNGVNKSRITIGSRGNSQRSSLWEHSILDDVVGDKGIYSTTRDLLNWYRSLSLGRILNDTNINLMLTFNKSKPNSVRAYGLGIRWKNIDGRDFIYHNGRWNGYRSAYVYRPDTKLLVIALSNTTHSAPRIVTNIIDLYDKKVGKLKINSKEGEEEKD